MASLVGSRDPGIVVGVPPPSTPVCTQGPALLLFNDAFLTSRRFPAGPTNTELVLLINGEWAKSLRMPVVGRKS